MSMTDYTKQRKSKTILVCPKCGRKGMSRGVINANRPNSKKYRLIVHTCHLVTVAGIQFNHVEDSCTVEVTE